MIKVSFGDRDRRSGHARTPTGHRGRAQRTGPRFESVHAHCDVLGERGNSRSADKGGGRTGGTSRAKGPAGGHDGQGGPGAPGGARGRGRRREGRTRALGGSPTHQARCSPLRRHSHGVSQHQRASRRLGPSGPLVKDPVLVFQDAASSGCNEGFCTQGRALRRRHYPAPSPDDRVVRVLAEMAVRVDACRAAPAPLAVTSGEVAGWASQVGFSATSTAWSGAFPRAETSWWPSLSGSGRRYASLDEGAIEEVSKPAVEALRAMPTGDCLPRATADILVLERR